MRKQRKNVWMLLFFMWLMWSGIFGICESVKMEIPETMRLHEELATEVLSGTGKKIDPEQLYLDFAGNVEVSRKNDGTYQAVCSLFGMIPLKTMEVEVISRTEVIPGGIPVGIYVRTDGIFVIGTGPIDTENGKIESPAQNVIKTGDYITSFQGEKISQKEELTEKLEQFEGEELVLGIRRNQEELEIPMTPVFVEGEAKLGIWVRDDTQGVGTLTYVTADRKFGALGHGISDSDSELLMEVSEGKLYDCEIYEIVKGEAGTPGKLLGKINYRLGNLYGQISGNLTGGIYGSANNHLMNHMTGKPVEIALKQEVTEGKAEILSAVDGTLRSYEVEITKLRKGEKDIHRGMEIQVTDEALISLTGGIVRGMSGSPILKDGKIIGAVTHVFVNDPTRGYGIFIEEMLEH